MKKNNLYFTAFYGRKNLLLEAVYAVCFKISSYPRMVMEVFIRKNFGKRYFSVATALTIIAALIGLPYLASSFNGDFFYSNTDKYSWYLFIALFAGFSIKHVFDDSYASGVLDFGRFSLYAGDVNPMFNIQIWGWKADIRTIETLLEPGLFFVIGMVLSKFGLTLGMLFMFVSIIYTMSYFAAYHMGDNFFMDMIDEMIMNEETENALVRGMSGDQTRGVRFFGDRPSLYTHRQELADAIVHDPSKVEFTFAE